LTANNDDFTTRLMDDMDPTLLDFVKQKVNSFIKWDLVRFFYENPHTADTVENIAKYAGRSWKIWLRAALCKRKFSTTPPFIHYQPTKQCARWLISSFWPVKIGILGLKPSTTLFEECGN